ncbi:MAG: caspase family protein [Chitinophagaceae bacterium]|nr:caspase family protein [Chitinophagaceae bacterium]
MSRGKSFIIFLLLFLIAGKNFGQKPELLLPVGHASPISGVCFSPDGKLAVTNGVEEKNVKIWETSTGNLIKTIDAHAEKISSVSFSPDGKYLLTTGHDQNARIWDVGTGTLYHSIYYRFNNWIEKGFFSSDGKRILLISDDAMELHDLSSKKLIRPLLDTTSFYVTQNKFRNRYRFFDYDMSYDGRFTITANSDSSIKLWDNGSGKILGKVKDNQAPFHQCSFSRNGEKLLAVTRNGTTIWETNKLKQIRSRTAEKNSVWYSLFHPDGQKVLTISAEPVTLKAMLELWDIKTGAVIQSYKLPGDSLVVSAVFNREGNLLLTMGADGVTRLWETQTGKLLRTVSALPPILKASLEQISLDDFLRYMQAAFSNNSKYIIAASLSNVALVQDAHTGKEVAKLEGISSMISMPRYNADGSLLATAVSAGIADNEERVKGYVAVWDMVSGNHLYELKGHNGLIKDIKFSPDNRYIATASADSTARVWDVYSGKQVSMMSGHEKGVYKCYFADSSRYIITQTFNGQARIWDTETGDLLAVVKHDSLTADRYGVYYITLSQTGKYFITVFYDDYKAVVTETATGKKLFSFDPKRDSVFSLRIDPSEKYLMYRKSNRVHITDIQTGEVHRLFELSETKGLREAMSEGMPGLAINKKGDVVAITTAEDLLKLVAFPSGKLLAELKPGRKKIAGMEFTADGKFLLTNSYDTTIKVWDVQGGKLHTVIRIGEDDMFGFPLTRNGKQYFATRSFESVMKIWDISTGKVVSSALDKFNHSLTYVINPVKPEFIIDNKFSVDLYKIGSSAPALKIIAAGNAGYLVVDSAGRYDGSNEARKLLYFTCGTEIISLDQVKDQLWVPGLAELICKGDTIRKKTLDEMGLCGLTPQVQDISRQDAEYNFLVTPRRGGFGETVLYVNGIEAKRYKPAQLIRSGNDYRLHIKRSELNAWFVAGQTNRVSVKAYTAGNDVSSRSVIEDEEADNKTAVAPSLYAVMIGVSDYKGDELDLKYAGKDAMDMANAVAVSARKLLNTDGKEHVFIYNLNTEKDRSGMPDKNTIRMTLSAIGKKATPNDILLIFFAGHGMMAGERKQFYFLTEDASKATAADATADVGISTAELTEWMKPQNIKAQKRILVFDACNSGQAIRDFVKLGGDDQNYVASRDDEKAEQVKAIEKLNEKSGLFILSASASNQKAYEMSRYSQGILTYSLLKAIKQQPDILDDGKYLNVSRWFGAAEKTVTELSKENGVKQQPQLVSNSNFNIGVVDEEVMAKINLPQEKPLFAASSLQNSDESIAADDLGLDRLVDNSLSALSERGTAAPITFIANTATPDAYKLSGRYEVRENAILVKVNVRRGKDVKRFEVTGTTDKLNILAAAIAEQAAQIVK